jgi:AcrR family transcriptional regulator
VTSAEGSQPAHGEPDDTPADVINTGRVGRPRGPRRSRHERRAELLDAAERAIERIGPDASMDELAAEAGITKPILYSHFGDKAGLASALAERVAAELDEAIAASLGQMRHPQEVVRSTIDAFCTFIESQHALYRFLIKAAMGYSDERSRSKLIAGFAEQIAEVLGDALRYAGSDARAAEPWSYAIVGMTLSAGEWWLDCETMSKDDLVSYLTQLLWSGLEGAGLARVAERVEPIEA